MTPLPPTQKDSSALSLATKMGMGFGTAIGLAALALLGAFFVVVVVIPYRRKRKQAQRRTQIYELESPRVETVRPRPVIVRNDRVIGLEELLAENQRIRRIHLNERVEIGGRDGGGGLDPPIELVEMPGHEVR